ncbi:site-specific integrase [Nocardia sp. NBC_01499]|uniref:tyrosine-type recombinase/integrase n=1 Tax=Nocardia sp. NBC_01499 TaxID=2903597 RepID=UPI00386A698B
MTAARLVVETAVSEPDEAVAAELWSLIKPEFLAMFEWSPTRRVLLFPKQHPLFGRKYCIARGCGVKAENTEGLCNTCRKSWEEAGRPSLTEFSETPRDRLNVSYGECRVGSCRRPWETKYAGICREHNAQRTRVLNLTVREFLVSPDVVGLESIGPCSVAACTRERHSVGPYCHIHDRHWRKLRQQHRSETGAMETEADEQRFQLRTPAIPFGNECSLRGLPDRVVAEVLLGLQQRAEVHQAKTTVESLRHVTASLVMNQAESIEQLVHSELTENAQGLYRQLVTLGRRARITPESERVKDEWDTSVFGFTGTLRFGKILQPWLREATKVWAYNELPQRRGTATKSAVQFEVKCVTVLSESLWLQRPGDHGNDPSVLSRSDICGFLNRMMFLVANDSMSAKTRRTTITSLRRVFGKMRGLGLARAGQSMQGLPDDFAIHLEDIPAPEEPDPLGRDLPVEVMRHICSHLDELEHRSAREVRVAVELLIDTGRRPDEICQLPLDCLDRDAQGKPVLIYTNFKSNRPESRLPIPEATAAVIMAQQERVRSRFSGEPADKLKLISAASRNPHGRRAFNDQYVSMRHREWVLALPEITLPLTVEEGGKLVTKMLPFDRSKIFLYAYRHTYAQRHADAGVPIDVLSELMGHRSITTTQGYYTVVEKRRRDAVDRLTTMHFDRHGNKIWRAAEVLLEAEHMRRAVGEVAVPYGSCSEPSNVAAGGNDCPVRFRCVGCAHFSTDVSYLPDLEAYLADLLRSRERLRGALEADDWAKAEAMPSDEEIIRIRRLISRVKANVDDLSGEDREKIEEAIGVVRRARNRVVGLGTPRIRQPLPDIRPDRSA